MDLNRIKHQVQKIITQVAIGYNFDYLEEHYDAMDIIRAYKQMQVWNTGENKSCLIFLNEVNLKLSKEEYPELWI